MPASLGQFNELFRIVGDNSLAALHAFILNIKTAETVFELLNQKHPTEHVTILQRAVDLYPQVASLKLINILLDYGANTEVGESTSKGDGFPSIDINVESDRKFQTPLWSAVLKNAPYELVELLLEYKADIYFTHTIEDTKNYSLLHLAVFVGIDERTLDLLVESGKSLLVNDQRNSRKESPLSTLKSYISLL